MEELGIPSDFEYDCVPGFSREVVEKLKKVRPSSVGQASRISGITPAAVTNLLIYLKRRSDKHPLPSRERSNNRHDRI